MTSTALYYNAQIVLPDRIQSDGWVLVKDGRFAEIGSSATRPQADHTVDVLGNYIFPGLVDLQINGGGGKNFIECSSDADIDVILQANLATGTTSLLPTLIVSTLDRLKSASHLIATCTQKAILGIHLEAPFLNPEFAGMHDTKYVQLLTIALAKELLDAAQGQTKIMTLSPELDGALELIAFLKAQKVIASLGHSNATAQQTHAALQAGASMGTHLYNRMSPVHHHSDRAGMVPVLLNSGAACGIIADLQHVNSDVLCMAFHHKTANLFLVSDSIAPLGTRLGHFIYQGEKIEVRNGTCFTQKGIMAGSATPLFKGVINAHRLGFPLHEMVYRASLLPAQLIGCDSDLGSIASGKYADFLIVDQQNLNLKAVYKDGQKFERVFNV
jgi:N-acetylglucosamine-6-phosphate deacetylase